MAAGEDQPQSVIFDALVVPRDGVFGGRFEGFGIIVQRVEPGTASQSVDGLETAGRNEPRAGIRGHPIPRPLLHRCSKGIVQRFLGEVEVAEQAYQGGEDAARVGAVDGVYRLAHALGGVLAHRRSAR